MFQKLEPLFYYLAQKDGYQFFEGAGAGHFVKMIHNGIEYGIMQAIAEGFTILKKAKYKLNLSQVADVSKTGDTQRPRFAESASFSPKDAPWAKLISCKVNQGGDYLYLRYRF